MNTAILRLLAQAAARAAEQGTLVEIVETAARLMSLIRPLLAGLTEAGAPPTRPR